MGLSVARKEKGTRTLPSTADRYFVDIPAFPELLRMTRLSYRVATRALSLRFCRGNFNSGDFFLAIFSPVASQFRGALQVRFSSRAGDATKFEKIASPAQPKKTLVWPRLNYMKDFLPVLPVLREGYCHHRRYQSQFPAEHSLCLLLSC